MVHVSVDPSRSRVSVALRLQQADAEGSCSGGGVASSRDRTPMGAPSDAVCTVEEAGRHTATGGAAPTPRA